MKERKTNDLFLFRGNTDGECLGRVSLCAFDIFGTAFSAFSNYRE